MNKEHYKLYENKEYMNALNILLNNSEFILTQDHSIPEDFIKGYVNYFKEQVKQNPDNMENKNALIFIEKVYFSWQVTNIQYLIITQKPIIKISI